MIDRKRERQKEGEREIESGIGKRGVGIVNRIERRDRVRNTKEGESWREDKRC